MKPDSAPVPSHRAPKHVPATFDAAYQALAKATSLGAIKTVRDKAQAIRVYAHEASDVALFEKATRLFIEAERRAGELLLTMPKAIGTRSQLHGRDPSGGSRMEPPEDHLKTLADFGITKKQSAKWQRLARMAEATPRQFEAYVERAIGRVVAVVDPDSVTETMRAAVQESNRSIEAVVPNVPEGRYACIVIDPPWPMQKIEREVRPRQVGLDYPVMSEAALAAFDVPSLAADDCHLFCWATQKHLPCAFKLAAHWGFRYVMVMVWHKSGGFQPVGLPQYNAEFVVYARHGHPQFVDTTAFPVCFEAPRREHSRKPDFFYDLVSRVTAGPRIDVFSREIHAGFAQYGNEPTRFNDELPR